MVALNALASEQMGRKGCLVVLELSVPFTSLVKNDIDDFVVFADILRGNRHDRVNDFGEELDIAMGIILNTRNEMCSRIFVL